MIVFQEEYENKNSVYLHLYLNYCENNFFSLLNINL